MLIIQKEKSKITRNACGQSFKNVFMQDLSEPWSACAEDLLSVDLYTVHSANASDCADEANGCCLFSCPWKLPAFLTAQLLILSVILKKPGKQQIVLVCGENIRTWW